MTFRRRTLLTLAQNVEFSFIVSGSAKEPNIYYGIFKCCLVFPGHAMPIRSLTFSPDSQLLITASDDNHIKMYDVYHSKMLVVFKAYSHTCLLVILVHQAHPLPCISPAVTPVH